MALSIANNVAALSTQNNLTKTNSTLSKSLERLSSGLKINRGADGPASLVISEQQRAQINGLRTALDNTDKAVSLIQTGEGALNKISSLLTKARSLALNAAKATENDVLTANQEEIKKALDSIDNIALSTKFGTQQIFDDQLRTFQIGASAGQTVSFTLNRVSTDSLGKGATNNVSSLSAIDVSSTNGALDAVKVLDQAITEVSQQRAALGALQANTLESNANNLRASLENVTAAESVIRNTDFATEIDQFTKNQVQLQAGSTVLGNANQIPQLVASLLRG